MEIVRPTRPSYGNLSRPRMWTITPSIIRNLSLRWSANFMQVSSQCESISLVKLLASITTKTETEQFKLGLFWMKKRCNRHCKSRQFRDHIVAQSTLSKGPDTNQVQNAKRCVIRKKSWKSAAPSKFASNWLLGGNGRKDMFQAMGWHRKILLWAISLYLDLR